MFKSWFLKSPALYLVCQGALLAGNWVRCPAATDNLLVRTFSGFHFVLLSNNSGKFWPKKTLINCLKFQLKKGPAPAVPSVRLWCHISWLMDSETYTLCLFMPLLRSTRKRVYRLIHTTLRWSIWVKNVILTYTSYSISLYKYNR